MTGSGTLMEVMARLTLPSVKVSPLAHSMPNSATMSPADCSGRVEEKNVINELLISELMARQSLWNARAMQPQCHQQTAAEGWKRTNVTNELV
jgi:hypothetical protein